MNRLERLIERCERGDPEAQAWVAFLNLTLISVLVMAIVAIAEIWI